MNLQVPFRSENSIENEANALLQSYGLQVVSVVEPPVPVEEILENFLGLTLEMTDLCLAFEKPDILGALYVATRTVAVDTNLDPSIRPEVLGRYRFTLGHEIGHWQLHREHFLDAAQQANLFGQGEGLPSVVCRETARRDPIEWQADRFSAALLMPRKLVARAWGEFYGDAGPTISEEEYEIATGKRRHQLHLGGVPDPFEEFESDLFRRAAGRIAPAFDVSVEAMKIRLQTLGLLVRSRVPELPLVGVHA